MMGAKGVRTPALIERDDVIAGVLNRKLQDP